MRVEKVIFGNKSVIMVVMSHNSLLLCNAALIKVAIFSKRGTLLAFSCFAGFKGKYIQWKYNVQKAPENQSEKLCL